MAAVRVEKLTRRYGPVTALDGVDASFGRAPSPR
jgi:hypothetical protein